MCKKVDLFAYSKLNHSKFYFQAFLIAFTSEFIPKLVYKYEHSWNMNGYVNFTLATSPYNGWFLFVCLFVCLFVRSFVYYTEIFSGWLSDGKEQCRYRAFRDNEGNFTPSHYKILGLKLAFVIIFEVSFCFNPRPHTSLLQK